MLAARDRERTYAQEPMEEDPSHQAPRRTVHERLPAYPTPPLPKGPPQQTPEFLTLPCPRLAAVRCPLPPPLLFHAERRAEVRA